MAKITNLEEYRRGKQRQEEKKDFLHRLFRLLPLLLLAAVAALFVYFANSSEIQSYIRENITGSSAGTGYPLALGSKNAKSLRLLEGNPLVLTETNLQAFDRDGGLVRDVQHGYKNPGLAVNGKYALLYDRGAAGFQLGTKNKTLFEKKSTETILTGSVSSKGKVGIATAREGFGSSLTVYSPSGEVSFEWYTTESYITCISLDENRALAGAVSTDLQGAYQSVIYYFGFRESDALFKLELPGEIVHGCAVAGNSLDVVTDQNYYRLGRGGEVEEVFPYQGKKLAAFALSGECTALFLCDSLGDYRQELSVFVSPGRATLSAYEVRPVSGLKAEGTRVFFMEGGFIRGVEGANGELLPALVADDNDRDMAALGDTVYVLSSDTVTEHRLGDESDAYVLPAEKEQAAANGEDAGFWDGVKSFFGKLLWSEEKPQTQDGPGAVQPSGDPSQEENLPAEAPFSSGSPQGDDAPGQDGTPADGGEEDGQEPSDILGLPEGGPGSGNGDNAGEASGSAGPSGGSSGKKLILKR